jgi:hypothetical protein
MKDGYTRTMSHAAVADSWADRYPLTIARAVAADTARGRAGSCIYLSGPMTGIADFNRPMFNQIADHLRSQGYPVINPADFGINEGESWADCLARDLVALVHCKFVVTLQGCGNSKGARLECHVAKELGIPVFTLAEFEALP